MKTFAIVDGDLRVAGHGHALVTGANKTVQDLGLALRETYGVDRFHPQWGSLLPEFIGSPADPFSLQRIESEVKRVITNYVVVHQETIDRLKASGHHHDPLRMSEVIADVERVQVRLREFGRFDVAIILRTVNRRRVRLDTTI